MISKFILSFLAFSVLFSCSRKKQIPDDVIPMDKMGMILSDMHVSDALSVQSFAALGAGDSVAWKAKSYRFMLMKKYDTDTARFNKSFKFYVSNPDLLDDMYQNMITDINNRITELREKSAPIHRSLPGDFPGKVDPKGYPVFIPVYDNHESGSFFWPVPAGAVMAPPFKAPTFFPNNPALRHPMIDRSRYLKK